MYEHKVIGYVAFNREKTDVICDGNACIVAGSKRKMKEYIQHHSTVKDAGIIKKAYFSDIINVLSLGGAYLLDEESYNRFINLSNNSGLNLHVIENEHRDSEDKLKLFRIEMK
jgi:hypothetical protein